MNDGDNYADAPVSVSELRSDKTRNGADWTPRDVLIKTLRELDRGEINPDALIICTSEPAPAASSGAQVTGYSAACPNPLIAYGLLVDTILKLGHTIEQRGRR